MNWVILRLYGVMFSTETPIGDSKKLRKVLYEAVDISVTHPSNDFLEVSRDVFCEDNHAYIEDPNKASMRLPEQIFTTL